MKSVPHKGSWIYRKTDIFKELNQSQQAKKAQIQIKQNKITYLTSQVLIGVALGQKNSLK